MIFSEKSETPNLTDYLKAKPDSVVYYGDKKSTASWQLLYFIALKLIAAKHPDELMRLERKSILGDKIEIGSEIEIREFSHPLGIMRKPDGKWLFAETDFNVQQILLRLKKLMEICKDPLDTMVIYFSANQSQNVSLRTNKSDSPLIRKSLAEIFRPKVPKATPTVTTAEQQYVQWLIQKGEKPSEAQAAFSMTEKVINRLQISAKRLFSVTSAVELKYILSALRRTPQWHYFSSRQQNQIVHTIDLYREFRESSAKALANAQAASTVQPPATASTSHPSVLPAPALSGSQKISSPEKFSCAGANPLEVLFDGKHIEAKTWKDVYVAGVKELYSRYPQKFISLIGDPDNKTGIYIETAYRAHKLKGLKVLTKNSAGQWLYLETEKTPDEAMTSLYKLLDHCGVAHTALSVQCKKAESDVPVTVTDVSIPQVVSSAPAKPIAKPVAAPIEKTAVRTPPNANSSAFYQWMRNEMHLAESSSRSYASAINNCEQLARQIGLDSTALYGVSLEVATRTYVFEKISKRGWLISGGTVSRASLIYDNAKKTGGLLTRFDFVGFDEVQSITFEQPGQIQQALKHYMEYGEIKGFDASLSSGAGVIVLGNIDADRFDTNKNMVANISEVFGESATLDRFHGFIPGWEIPRMTTGMIAKGWAINTEYFAEVMHTLRDDLTYSAVVDAMIDFPSNADKRHMTAIKRLCTAFLKLLFPHVQTPNDIDRQEFIDYCLNPAIEMRSAIYKQLCIIDAKEYDVPSKRIPEIVCK